MLIRQPRIGDVAISHAQAIQQVRFSSMSTLATCGKDNRVRVWDWDRQQQLHEFAGSRFAFSPEGAFLYVASRERRHTRTSYGERSFSVANLVKYDLRSGTKIAESEPAEIEICALAVSPRGSLVASARLTEPAVFHDAQTMEPRFQLKPPRKGTVGSIQFLNEDRALTRGYTINDYDEVAYLWNLRSRKRILTFAGASTPLAVSPDGRFAAAGATERGRVRVWDLRDGTMLRECSYADEQWVMETAFFHQAPLLAVVGQGDRRNEAGRLKVWNVETGELVEDRTPAGHPGWLYSVCISPDDRWVVAGAGDGRLRVWDWQSRIEQLTITGHSERVQSLVCLDSDTLLSSGYHDRTIRRWCISDGKPLGIERTFEEIADKLAHSSVRELLASSHGSLVLLWSLHEGTIADLAELVHPRVRGLCLSRDGKRLVTSGSDGTIRLWDLESRSEMVRLEVHGAKSDCFIGWLALCPDETQVAFTQMWRSSVAIWDWHTKAEIATLKSARRDLGPLAFSPDGHWLAAGGADSGEITIWSWPEGQLVHRLEAEGGGHINALAFCPMKPHLLASADAGGNVEVFDLHTGARIAQDNIESGQAWSLAYSPDGRRLIAGSEFGVIVIWELELNR